MTIATADAFCRCFCRLKCRNMAKLLFADEYDKIDYGKCEAAVDAFLMHLAFAETMVRKRLKQLSGER